MKDHWIIEKLDVFIDWLEATILRLSILCLVGGAMLGTVAVLVPVFKLSSIPWYGMLWADVQAVALDGVFVGVLFHLRDNWRTQSTPQRVWYVTLASTLGLITCLVNVILGYQELYQLASVTVAMSDLGISQIAFVYTRSVIVVLVTILVCTLPRKRVNQGLNQGLTSLPEGLNQGLTSLPEGLNHIPDGLTTYERVYNYLNVHPTGSNRDIAEYLELNQSTVKLYAARVRSELKSKRLL